MKQLFILILAMVYAHLSWAYDVEVEGVYYNLNEEAKTATVTWGWASYEGDVVIPGEIIKDDVSYAVTRIENSAFYYCTGLTSVSIPESVRSIGNTAFFNCLHLRRIVIPENVETIGNHAFARCSALLDVTIPNSVNSLGEYSFQGCTKLSDVTLSNSLTEIKEGTFYECKSLKKVVIPASVESIVSQAFGACPSTESLSVEEGSEWFFSDGNCIIDNGNTLVLGCKTSVIPEYVSAIGREAFYNSAELASIVIPDGVTVIDVSAFEGCEGLTEVTIGNGVTRIADRAFEGCSGLTEVVVPDAVTSIGNCAFWYCSALKEVTIGRGVEYIDYHAFTGCKALREMTCQPTTMIECDEDTFYDLDTSKGTLYVPAELVEQYRNTLPWSSWGTISAIIDPTGIDMPMAENCQGKEIYSVDGRRLQKVQKGINIVNGRKILIK